MASPTPARMVTRRMSGITKEKRRNPEFEYSSSSPKAAPKMKGISLKKTIAILKSRPFVRTSSPSKSPSPVPSTSWHYHLWDMPALPGSHWPTEEIWNHANAMRLHAHNDDEKNRWERTMFALETCTCETREAFVPEHVRPFKPIYTKHTVVDYLKSYEEHMKENGTKVKLAQTDHPYYGVDSSTPSPLSTGPPCMKEKKVLFQPCCSLWNFLGPNHTHPFEVARVPLDIE